MFDRKIFKKKPTYFPPGNIGTNNLIDPDKRKHLKEKYIWCTVEVTTL